MDSVPPVASELFIRSRESAQIVRLRRLASIEEDAARLQLSADAGLDTATSLPGVPPGLASSTVAHFSLPDGNLLLWVDPDTRACTVFRVGAPGEPLEPVTRVGGTAQDEFIQDAAFSPCGAFLVTWSRPHERLADGNLRIWRCATGEAVRAFPHRHHSATAFPYVQWTADERYALHAVANALDVYDGSKLEQPPLLRIGIPGLVQFAVAPEAVAAAVGALDLAYVATFVPESANGAPAVIQVWAIGSSSAIRSRHGEVDGLPASGKEARCAVPVASRRVYRAQHVEFYWSPKVYGSGSSPSLVIRTSHDYDVHGRSYYGESSAHFLYLGNKSEQSREPARDPASMPEGPIHDIGWSPTGREFVIVHGTTPARATLFHGTGTATFDFGTGPRNRVSWSPHGRFLALAGFGSMSGNVQIWDRNKKKLIGQFQAECTTHWQWSPCSRFFLVGVCYPRMKVDNGFRIFKYDGTLVYERKMPTTQLYQVEWRARVPEQFPDRPVSPQVLASMRKMAEQMTANTDASQKGNGSVASAVAGNQTRPSGAYIPPHLRRQVIENGVSMPPLKLHEHEAPQSLVSGPFLTKSQRKNRKKKEREARQQQQDIPSV